MTIEIRIEWEANLQRQFEVVLEEEEAMLSEIQAQLGAAMQRSMTDGRLILAFRHERWLLLHLWPEYQAHDRAECYDGAEEYDRGAEPKSALTASLGSRKRRLGEPSSHPCLTTIRASSR